MCSCKSQWVNNAKTFVQSSQNHDEKWETVKFLLDNNHCGGGNTVKMNDIISHLNSNNSKTIDREKFQKEILGELKKRGLVATLVYPGPKGGVFIPCTVDEIKTVTKQVLMRIDSEVENLDGILKNSQYNNLLSSLKSEILNIQNRI